VAVAVQKIPSVLSWRLMRQVTGRLSWGLGDQVMSTLTNFLLTTFVARTLGATQFGAFSLAYVTYGFAINVSRGLSTEPLLIRFSGTDLPAWRRATAGCSGTALLVGLATGACALVAGALIGGTTGLAFLALGLTLPGLILQDSWRYAFFAVGRGHHAFINDTIWAVIQIPALVFLKITGHASVFWFVLAWGGAACVGAAAGSLQSRVLPNLARAMEWLVRHRDLGPRYVAENTGPNAADMVRGYGVSNIIGLAAVGDIQAASVPMGPFRVIFLGVSLIIIPEAARVLRRSPRHLPLLCAAVSTGLTLLVMGWGALLLVAMPHGLGHLLLGGLWQPAYPLMVPTILTFMAMCAGAGSFVGMHAVGAARRSMRAVILTTVLVVVGALTGAATAGARGSLFYLAAASWLGVLLSWWQLRQALHEFETTSVPRWLWPRSAGRHHGSHGTYSHRQHRTGQGTPPGYRAIRGNAGAHRSGHRAADPTPGEP
jgi:O-antigen/teichoic acid export membrane protein